MEFKDYIKSYSIISIVFKLFFGIAPLLGRFMNLKYFAPPVDVHILLIFLLPFIVAIYFTFYLRKLKLWKTTWGAPLIMTSLMLIALSSMMIYIYFYEVNVVSIDMPGDKATVRVIVGSERTEFAKNKFPGVPDIKMVKEAGHAEEYIMELYVARSVARSKMELVISYFVMLFSFIQLVAIGTLTTFIEKNTDG